MWASVSRRDMVAGADVQRLWRAFRLSELGRAGPNNCCRHALVIASLQSGSLLHTPDFVEHAHMPMRDHPHALATGPGAIGDQAFPYNTLPLGWGA